MRRVWKFAAIGFVALCAASVAAAGAASRTTYSGSTSQRLSISLTVDAKAKRVASVSVRYACGRTRYVLTASSRNGVARLGRRGDFRYNAPRSAHLTWISGRVAAKRITGRLAATRKGCRIFATFTAPRRLGAPPVPPTTPSSLRCRAPQRPAFVTPDGASRQIFANMRPRAGERAMCWPMLTYSGKLDTRATLDDEGHSSGTGSRSSSSISMNADVGGTATFMLTEAWLPNKVVGRYRVITPNIGWILAYTSADTLEQFSTEFELIPGGFFSTTKTCTRSVAGASSVEPEWIGKLQESGEVLFFLRMPSPSVIESCKTTYSDGRPTTELTHMTYVQAVKVGNAEFDPGRFDVTPFLKGSYGATLQAAGTEEGNSTTDTHKTKLTVTRSFDFTGAGNG